MTEKYDALKTELTRIDKYLAEVEAYLAGMPCNFWACDGKYKNVPKDMQTCSVCRVAHVVYLIRGNIQVTLAEEKLISDEQDERAENGVA